MSKITDIETLHQFEKHCLASYGQQIVVWNVLSKEMYFKLKKAATDSLDFLKKEIENKEKNKTPASPELERILSNIVRSSEVSIPGMETHLKDITGKSFYEKRITERTSFDCQSLLKAELLPEELLREMYLKNIDTFTLLQAGEIYIGVLSVKRARVGLESLLNNCDIIHGGI